MANCGAVSASQRRFGYSAHDGISERRRL